MSGLLPRFESKPPPFRFPRISSIQDSIFPLDVGVSTSAIGHLWDRSLRVSRAGMASDITCRADLRQCFTAICLSSDMTSGCYKADAVWRFLEECWGFQQQATDIIRSIDPELARQSQESIDKVRRWSRAFHIFGPTLFLGMAVLNNVQVRRHLDPGDNKIKVMTINLFKTYATDACLAVIFSDGTEG